MNNMKKQLFYIVLALMFAACANEDSTLDIKGMFSPQGETVNTRFEQSMAYNMTKAPIRIDMHQDDYTIYVCSDSHITRKNHKNLDYFVAQYDAAAGPKLALHLGDLIDAQKNFPCADSILHLATRTSADTMFITPGNHDIYFCQWPIYLEFFKSSVYWFETTNGTKKLDLFICLDSAEGSLGTKQSKWLKELLEAKSQEGYRRIIVFTHTHLWKLDASQGHTSNMALEETYEILSLMGQYGVEYVWSGHQHARQSVMFKGVQYLVLEATKDTEKGQAYMIAEMGETVKYQHKDYPPLN